MSNQIARTSVLVVDDDRMVRLALSRALEKNGFGVTCAENVPSALKCITSQLFDVLLTDLHMPGAGDGLTLVSAMRHANPKAVTMLFTSFPEMAAAADAILQQTDEILVKPMPTDELVSAISQRIAAGPLRKPVVQSLANLLEKSMPEITEEWCTLIETEEALKSIVLGRETRCKHLPSLFDDLVRRLHAPHPLGSRKIRSEAAAHHGHSRLSQGYTAAMMVEESRLLQVAIFKTLERNLASIDFSVLLPGVMAIVDEVASQLSQAMEAYVADAHSMAA